MLRKFHEAKMNGNADVKLWGTGKPKRQFLHVDDLAEAISFALEIKLTDHIYNVGHGSDLSIKTLAETIQSIVGHQGRIIWDASMPDGTPRKWMDCSKLRNLGWEPRVDLETGIRQTYTWFLKHQNSFRKKKIS